MIDVQAAMAEVLQAIRDGTTIEVIIRVTAPSSSVKHTVTCGDCGWSGTFSTVEEADRELRRHKKRCMASPQIVEEFPWLRDLSAKS